MLYPWVTKDDKRYGPDKYFIPMEITQTDLAKYIVSLCCMYLHDKISNGTRTRIWNSRMDARIVPRV